MSKNKTTSEELRDRFAEPLNLMQYIASKHGRYIVFYTHSYEQGYKDGQNLLVLPADSRFDEKELIGLCIDMIMDYYEKTGRNPIGDKMLLGAGNVLRKMYEKGFPEK